MTTPAFNEAPEIIQRRSFAVSFLRKIAGSDKLDKQPLSPTTLKAAETNDIDTLGTYEEAKDAVIRGRAKICGPVLKRDGIICLDLDNAFNPTSGEITEGASLVLAMFFGALVTLSVSGTGFHIWIKAKPPAGMKEACTNLWTEKPDEDGVQQGQKIEILVEKFVAERWQIFGDPGEIIPLQSELNSLYEMFKVQPTPTPAPQPVTQSNGSYPQDASMDRRFLLGKLRTFTSTMKGMKEGQRHDKRYDLARTAAGYLHTGHIAEEDIWEAIGVNYGPDPENAKKTIRDAIVDGKANPLDYIRPPLPETPQVRFTGKTPVNASSNGHATTTEQPQDVDNPEPKSVDDGVYRVRGGRIGYWTCKGPAKEPVFEFNVVCDLNACFTEQIVSEKGECSFKISGFTVDGYAFEFSVSAEEFSDEKQLKTAIIRSGGATAVIRKGMAGHLAPAIQLLSKGKNIPRIQSFTRTGWHDGRFLIPGIETKGKILTLGSDLPYRVKVPEGEMSDFARESLEALLRCHNPSLCAIVLCFSLLAPLAGIAEWRDDRFGLFIAGRTGSFKTSVMCMAMSLYGDFPNEDKLLKFGQGATLNAMFAQAAALPDMIMGADNYKPGTGNGAKDAATFIHAVLEGTERKRLNRDGTRREAKDVFCWPILTGEDTVNETASIARMVILDASWKDKENSGLTTVQNASHHLPEVGGAWLKHLQDGDGKETIRAVSSTFIQKRSDWAVEIRKNKEDAVNALRIASSLARLEMTWEVALRFPDFKDLISPFTKDFKNGLKTVAQSMGNYTNDSHEAIKYVSGIRALIESNRAYVVEHHQDPDDKEKRLFIGWHDEKGGLLYLQSETVFSEVLKLLRDSGGLNGLGPNTILKQLDQLGFIAQKGNGQMTMVKKLGTAGKTKRVLCLFSQKCIGEEATH